MFNRSYKAIYIVRASRLTIQLYYSFDHVHVVFHLHLYLCFWVNNESMSLLSAQFSWSTSFEVSVERRCASHHVKAEIWPHHINITQRLTLAEYCTPLFTTTSVFMGQLHLIWRIYVYQSLPIQVVVIFAQQHMETCWCLGRERWPMDHDVLLFLVLLSGILCHRPYVYRPLHLDSFRVD